MSGSPSLTCSECGHTLLHEADLYRPRRRPFRAALALLFVFIIIIFVNLQLSSRRWTSHLPTGLLISCLPLTSSPTSDLYRELLSRISSNQLSQQQFLAFARRAATGDFFASPPSNAWIAKYGDVITTGPLRLSSDPSIIALLDAIPPRIDLHARSPWPQDTPPVISLRMRDWWSPNYQCRLTIQPTSADPALPPFAPAAFLRRPNDSFAPALPIALPALPPGKHHLILKIAIERRRVPSRAARAAATIPDLDLDSASPDPWQHFSTLDLTLDLVILPPAQLALAPASSAELTAAVRSIFRNGVTKWPSGPSPVRFFFDPTTTFSPAFTDTSVGLRVDLLHNSSLARRLEIWWLAGPQVPDRAFGWIASSEDLALLSKLDPADPAWQISVSADPALALRAGNAARYFNGSFTLPLSVQHRSDPAPPRAWTPDTPADQSLFEPR